MKKLLTIICLIAALTARADYTTLGLPIAAMTNATCVIPSNTVAQITGLWMQTGSSCTMNIHGVNLTTTSPPMGFTFTGPGSITLTNSGNAAAFITFQTFPAIAPVITNTPSTSVVIPSDNAGPVTIILESSTDLITWTAALPGTYGTTATNRFFRVRATR